MLFLGDIASPTEETTSLLQNSLNALDTVFRDQIIICNLEGAITDKIPGNKKTPVLYNHTSVPGFLRNLGHPVVCLANNHILDIPEKFGDTINILDREGILYCGAGFSPEEANRPAVFREGPFQVFLFNRCWDFLLYNNPNPSMGVYVATIKEFELLKSIELQREKSPDAKIIVYLHWNLDLESLPFPVHRQYAKELVKAGANIVVGSHSHCVQGGEVHNNSYILYGLGNFYIPNRSFGSGRIYYPEFASIELAMEWELISNSVRCHWFRYSFTNNQHHLIYLESEGFEYSKRLAGYSPFRNMGDKQFKTYFKENRRKRFLIPVYINYRNTGINRLYTCFLKIRARIARLLANMGIINWQR